MNCELCNKKIIKKYGSGRFCGQKCARSFSTHKNRDKINKKISMSLLLIKRPKKKKQIKKCICGKEFELNYKKQKYCGTKCGTIFGGRSGGLKSSQIQNRRSKNEIYFSKLCISKFKNVECNKRIFNGWDSDVIIHDLKIAILWNGPWHFRKITKKHSLKQVKNRDFIKIKEITKYGYKPYVINDNGKFNKKFVDKEFKKMINSNQSQCTNVV